jgi:hypothetical protein
MTTSGSPSSTSNLSALDPSSLFTASIDWPGVWQAVVDSVLAFCGRLLYALALLIVGWLVVSCLVLPLVRRIVRRKHYEKTVASFIELSVGAVLKVLLVIAAIDLLGVQVLSLTAFLAAFGLGIGASLTELIQNFFAGITLVAQRPVKVGDWLEVEGHERVCRGCRCGRNAHTHAYRTEKVRRCTQSTADKRRLSSTTTPSRRCESTSNAQFGIARTRNWCAKCFSRHVHVTRVCWRRRNHSCACSPSTVTAFDSAGDSG